MTRVSHDCSSPSTLYWVLCSFNTLKQSMELCTCLSRVFGVSFDCVIVWTSHLKWVEGEVVRERKGRERKYTGGGDETGGVREERGGGRGEGIISTQGGQVLSHVSCAWLHSKNFDIAWSLNLFLDLLLSLIQGCDVQNDAAVERKVDKTSAERLKPTELVQSAQKMARCVL